MAAASKKKPLQLITSEKPCSTRRLCGGDCRAYAKLSDDLIWSRMITDYIQEAPGIYVMMK
jgi:hypothetical protein